MARPPPKHRFTRSKLPYLCYVMRTALRWCSPPKPSWRRFRKRRKLPRAAARAAAWKACTKLAASSELRVIKGPTRESGAFFVLPRCILLEHSLARWEVVFIWFAVVLCSSLVGEYLGQMAGRKRLELQLVVFQECAGGVNTGVRATGFALTWGRRDRCVAMKRS